MLKNVNIPPLLQQIWYNQAMKQILIATTNPAKIITIKKILAKLGYEGLSFADLNLKLEEPDETQLTAEEIATEKALGYAKQYDSLPILARDDTNILVGVSDEDDPKNHNKAFVASRCGGEYSDELGVKVFADLAHKYGGEISAGFDWGYALAWRENGELKVVSGLASTGTDKTKIVDTPSPVRVPGFCFSPIFKVLIDGEWKYDSEFSEEDSWKAYWNIQAETISKLISECGPLK